MKVFLQLPFSHLVQELQNVSILSGFLSQCLFVVRRLEKKKNQGTDLTFEFYWNNKTADNFPYVTEAPARALCGPCSLLQVLWALLLWTALALCQQSSSDPQSTLLQINTASGFAVFSKKSYISGIKLNFFWRWLTQTHDRFFPRYLTPYVYFILALFGCTGHK